MLAAPFPWFGGKSRVADVVWRRLGADVRNYVEPFFGSGAVLLNRPGGPGKIETVNDKDGYLSNFWRAVAKDPEGVTKWLDWPVNENDLIARHAWLVERKAEFVQRIEGDPGYFDAQVAGWWVWGLCSWIGSGWCSGRGPWTVVDGLMTRGTAGQGVNRQLPHLGNAGRGVNRQLPHLGTAGRGVAEWFQALSERMRGVRIASGDWARVLGPSATSKHGCTAILLDPPYDASRTEVYAEDDPSVFAEVAAWAAANGDNPDLRIALCGYEGAFVAPPGWTVHQWKAKGGYGSQSNGRGRENSGRERVWFSPHCLPVSQQLECA